MACAEKDALIRAYESAAIAYNHAVRALDAGIDAPQAKWDRLSLDAAREREAWQKALCARDSHIKTHGC